ncbi:YhfX family PLP-dependent enzyme, partial [Rhizobiaceae sp. 2RAB30]
VSREPTSAASAQRSVEIPPPAAIDYYGMIDASGPAAPRVGDSVVFGFRAQAFVTRAYVVGISGLASGSPEVQTIHDAYGRPIDWPEW